MANGIRIQFRNQLNDTFVITVFPKENFDGEFTDFPAAAGSIMLSGQAGDDSKIFTGIIPKTFQFGYVIPSNATVGTIRHFIRPEFGVGFNAWIVEVRRGEQIFFKGYLNLENNSEEFFSRKRVVVLTAVDGLNTLKAIPFTKYGTPLAYGSRGETVLFWIFQVLGKIGFEDLPVVTDFNVTHNLMLSREIDPSYDPLDRIIIESQLWMNAGGVKNCDEVIKIICKAFKLRIYQENGQWIIESLADRIYSFYRSYSVWEFTGVFDQEMTYFQTDNALKITQVCSIGLNSQIKLVNADALRRIQTPKSSVKITYPYVFPDEWFCSQKLSTHGPAIPVPNNEPIGGGFLRTCWEHRRNDGTAPQQQSFHWHEFNNDDPVNGDIQDYAIGTQVEHFGGAHSSYVRSQYFVCSVGDSFIVSFTTKGTNTEKFGTDRDGPRALVRMILVGNSGAIYTAGSLTETTAIWAPSTAPNIGAVNNSNSAFIVGTYDDDERPSAWRTFETTIGNAPEGGRIYFDLMQWYDIIADGGGGQRTDFKNLSIILNIKNVGDFNQSSNTGLNIEIYEEDVQISDGYSASALGGLYNFSTPIQSGEVLYSPQWFFYGKPTQKRRFTQLMSYVLMSYQKRFYDKLETSVKGYAFESNGTVLHCGFLPRYIFMDYDSSKEFMLTGSFNFDVTRGIWTGVFVEVDASNDDDFQLLSIENELRFSFAYEFQYIKKRS